jgi:uncharacterized protein
MTDQVFFLHSAGAQEPHEGSSDLVAWLKEALGPKYDVLHPKMPNPEAPDYAPWKAKLKKDFVKLKGEVIFIGHSLGGSVLLKYLAEEPFANPIAGLFIVSAPFWGGDENWQYEPFTLSEDFAKRLPDIPKAFLYHSANDPIVPVAHQALYAEKLPRATVRRLDGDEHVWGLGLPELAADIKSLQ